MGNALKGFCIYKAKLKSSKDDNSLLIKKIRYYQKISPMAQSYLLKNFEPTQQKVSKTG
jgi:hypothetical protein